MATLGRTQEATLRGPNIVDTTKPALISQTNKRRPERRVERGKRGVHEEGAKGLVREMERDNAWGDTDTRSDESATPPPTRFVPPLPPPEARWIVEPRLYRSFRMIHATNLDFSQSLLGLIRTLQKMEEFIAMISFRFLLPR